MYHCKQCGDPVERAIEGELICEDCWTLNQMSSEEAAREHEAQVWLSLESQAESYLQDRDDPGCTAGQHICWWTSCSACKWHRGVPVERVANSGDPCGTYYNPDVPECELPF
jgi:hypothetical protein